MKPRLIIETAFNIYHKKDLDALNALRELAERIEGIRVVVYPAMKEKNNET